VHSVCACMPVPRHVDVHSSTVYDTACRFTTWVARMARLPYCCGSYQLYEYSVRAGSGAVGVQTALLSSFSSKPFSAV
jgi:hypothetical protein